MAQVFATTYSKFHRWFPTSKRTSLKPYDKVAESLPEGDVWFIDKQLDYADDPEMFEKAKASVQAMYRRRMWSTYQVCYCKDIIEKETKGEHKNAETETPKEKEEEKENELLEYCKALYSRKTQKILRPLATSRRLLGYQRPTSMYTPLTPYQEDWGRVGYKMLKYPHDYFVYNYTTKEAKAPGAKKDEKFEPQNAPPDVAKPQKRTSKTKKPKQRKVPDEETGIINRKHLNTCYCCTCRTIRTL